MTELVTGLGMLGKPTIDEALEQRPGEMVSVSPETWSLLARAYEGGRLAGEFRGAWENGVAFLAAVDGLRGRLPATIEWKGSHRAPGDEVAPIDLRIDHVYLVSCKYLSKILINASPFHLFDRLLQGGHGVRSGDWYEHVAGSELAELYRSVRRELGLWHLSQSLGQLDLTQRKTVSELMGRSWPEGAQSAHSDFVDAVSVRTAGLWRERIAAAGAGEALLWRLLRMGSAPYFVLGLSSGQVPLRLRIATPWDWRLSYRLRSFDVVAQVGGQPLVGWSATVEDRHSGSSHEVSGHVEVRWSHGRFCGNPEAKVYLDTPHVEVPGYYGLA